MNKPEQNSPESTPCHDNVDALIERLPAAYEAWEHGVCTPDMERIQRRVIELMREAENHPRAP